MPACQLTAETEVKILNHVGSGSKLVDAARDAGVAAGTVRLWIKHGEAGKKPYAEFVTKLRIAEAMPRNAAMRAWNDAIHRDWRAAKAFIEYLDKQQHSPANVARQLEDILQVVEDVLGEDESKKVLRALVERDSREETVRVGPAVRLVASQQR